MAPQTPNVVVEVKDRIARLELARVEKKNALTADMYRALADGLALADGDARVRAVLLHGRPDCFCAGNDLEDFLERDLTKESPALDFLRRIAESRKPIVAAVGGPAVGIGTTMLLHCDLVYAAPGARFQLPFVPLGLVPEAASSLLLPMLAGHARAAELLLLGQPFDAAKAVAAGIVTDVIPEDELLDHARAPAVAERMRVEGQLFAERLASPEAREAMTAFLEKRKPDFSRFD